MFMQSFNQIASFLMYAHERWNIMYLVQKYEMPLNHTNENYHWITMANLSLSERDWFDEMKVRNNTFWRQKMFDCEYLASITSFFQCEVIA